MSHWGSSSDRHHHGRERREGREGGDRSERRERDSGHQARNAVAAPERVREVHIDGLVSEWESSAQ